MPGITGPYSQLVFMMGLENVLIMMYDDPDGLKEAISKRVSHAIAWLDELIALGAEAVWIGEGAASSSVISPACYAEFVAPYAKAVVEAAKQRNIPCFMHVCGNIVPAIREIASTGCSAIDIDYMVPMALAKETAAGRCAVEGNVSTIEAFYQGTPEDVTRDANAVIDLFGNRGGLILSSACEIPRHTPRENVRALTDAARNYPYAGGSL